VGVVAPGCASARRPKHNGVLCGETARGLVVAAVDRMVRAGLWDTARVRGAVPADGPEKSAIRSGEDLTVDDLPDD
jgi:hypothetical protein